MLVLLVCLLLSFAVNYWFLRFGLWLVVDVDLVVFDCMDVVLMCCMVMFVGMLIAFVVRVWVLLWFVYCCLVICLDRWFVIVSVAVNSVGIVDLYTYCPPCGVLGVFDLIVCVWFTCVVCLFVACYLVCMGVIVVCCDLLLLGLMF